MPHQWIKYRSKDLYLHKAVFAPDFNGSWVLTHDPWEYVDLWLRRNKHSTARFYWEQAHQFHLATKGLSSTSAPLPLYYAILNATKTLLLVRKQAFSDQHGVSGYQKAGSTSLSKEIIRFKSGGIHAALRTYFQDTLASSDYSLKDILYNLPYVHRAFTLTYSSGPELFIPVCNPRFVRKDKSSEAWFCADIDGRHYQTQRVINKLDTAFERDLGLQDTWTVRMKDRFRWQVRGSQTLTNTNRLTTYHRKVRRHAVYIRGGTRLWYLKRTGVAGLMDCHTLPLMFAAAHKLSELARYSPMSLEKHSACQHNWLLEEFIALTLDQYIDEIASEITGQDFMISGLRSK